MSGWRSVPGTVAQAAASSGNESDRSPASFERVMRRPRGEPAILCRGALCSGTSMAPSSGTSKAAAPRAHLLQDPRLPEALARALRKFGMEEYFGYAVTKL